MLKIWIGITLALAGLAACAPMPAGPVYGPAPTVQSTPGRAVIYVVRTRPDASYLTAPITLDGEQIGSTFAGTYMRLEVPAGQHRLAGYAADMGAITLNVQADRVYFVQHSVAGSWRSTSPASFFTLLDEPRGRAALARTSQRTGAGA